VIYIHNPLVPVPVVVGEEGDFYSLVVPVSVGEVAEVRTVLVTMDTVMAVVGIHMDSAAEDNFADSVVVGAVNRNNSVAGQRDIHILVLMVSVLVGEAEEVVYFRNSTSFDSSLLSVVLVPASVYRLVWI
jgi:hypothetical protein